MLFDFLFKGHRRPDTSLFFQHGIHVAHGDVAAVHAAGALWRSALGVVPFSIVDVDQDGTRTPNTSLTIAKRLAQPNELDTWPALMESVTAGLLCHGRAVIYGLRDARGGLAGLYTASSSQRVADGRSLGYWQLDFAERFRPLFPVTVVASPDDVAVVEINVDPQGRPRSPVDVAGEGSALSAGALAYLRAVVANEARPGATLGTAAALTGTQIAQLREGLNDKSGGHLSGGTVILPNGLKPVSWFRTPAETAAAEQIRIGTVAIAQAFGVPAPLLEEHTPGSNSSTANLMQQFRLQTVHPLIVKLRASIARLAGVGLDSVVADLTPLQVLTDLERVDMLGRGVTAGIYAPNEARRVLGLSPVAGGDQVLVQQQMRPVDQPPAGV